MRLLSLATGLLLAGCGGNDRNAVVCSDPDAFHYAYMGAPPPAEVVLDRSRAKQALTSCNLEFINTRPLTARTPDVSRAELVTLKGWLIDSRTGSVGAPLRLRLQDADGKLAWEVPITERTERQDIVASNHGNPAFLLAGFRVAFYPGDLRPGRYALSLVIPGKPAEAVCGEGSAFGLR
jgi:hypothetical protein